MKFMFLFPLLLGFVPSAVLLLSHLYSKIGRVSFNLWNAAVGTFVCGCITVGIINNSGRSTDTFIIYCIIGAVMMVSSLLLLKKKD